MKKAMLLTVMAMVMLGSVGSVTALAAEAKIGVMDLNTVLVESDAGKAANAELATMVKERQTAVDQKGAEVEKLNQELEQAESLKEEERKAKQEQLDKLVQEYQQLAVQAENEIQTKAQELRNRILAEVGQVLRVIGERDNYSLIVDVSTVHYYAQVTDITWEVIRTYNELRAQE